MTSKTRRRMLTRGKRLMRHFINEALEACAEHDPEALRLITEREELSVRWWADHIIESLRKSGSVQEFRLNKAGLKLYVSWGCDGVRAHVGGDQRDNHPEVSLILSMILWSWGLLDKERNMGNTAPLTTEWILRQKWGEENSWACKWIHNHIGLLPPTCLQDYGCGKFPFFESDQG